MESKLKLKKNFLISFNQFTEMIFIYKIRTKLKRKIKILVLCVCLIFFLMYGWYKNALRAIVVVALIYNYVL